MAHSALYDLITRSVGMAYSALYYLITRSTQGSRRSTAGLTLPSTLSINSLTVPASKAQTALNDLVTGTRSAC